jgi:hypothetical protein
MKNSLGCFGAASVFDHKSAVCSKCQDFNCCADECLRTLDSIKDLVNVSDLLKRHHAARKAAGLPVAPRVPAVRPADTPMVANAAPEIMRMISAPPIQHKSQMSAPLKAHEAGCELMVAETDYIDASNDDPLFGSDEEFSIFLDNLAAQTPSLFGVLIAPLLDSDGEVAGAAAAAAAVAEITDDAGLQLVSTGRVDYGPIPPRFRKAAAPASFRVGGKYNVEETQSLRQRQLDDLIHLGNLGRSFSVHKKYEGLFIFGGGLNTQLAGDFVEEKSWSVEEKACKLLGLTEFEQLQCSALASKKIKDKWLNATKHAAKIEKQLNAQADHDEQFRQYVAEFTKLAQADYLCKGLDAKTLPLVLAWLTGKKPISRQGIDAKLKRLEKRLA